MNLYSKTKPLKYVLAFAVLLLIVVGYFAFGGSTTSASTSDFSSEPNHANSNVESRSMLLTLMEDAPYEESQYRIKASITTNYIVEHANVYLYSPETNSVQLVLDDYDVNANMIDHSFFAKPTNNAYAVIHLTYGPNFLFDRYSEAICIVPFLETNLYDAFDCDPLTTSEYLIAASTQDVDIDNLFSANVIREALYVKELPRTITYEHYLSIHQMLLAHVAETTGYLVANQRGQYLSNMLLLSKGIAAKVMRLRRLNISMLDKIAEEVDKSMVNLTYRIYMTLDGLLDRHAIRLTKLSQNNQLISDFFTGNAPFLLAGSETDIVVSVEYADDTVVLNYWPWFSGIQVKFDSAAEPFITKDRELRIPENARYVDITGQSMTGKYPTMRFSIAQKQNFERGLMGTTGLKSNQDDSASEQKDTSGNIQTDAEATDADIR